jgi:hypothetical protein
VCVGGEWVCGVCRGWGVVLVWCWGYFKGDAVVTQNREVKFDITVFEIRHYHFRDYRIRDPHILSHSFVMMKKCVHNVVVFWEAGLFYIFFQFFFTLNNIFLSLFDDLYELKQNIINIIL